MALRTKSRDRCPRCFIRRVLCVCEIVPSFDLKTRVVVLLHNRESKRPTNTGRLLGLALTHFDLHVRGVKGQRLQTENLVDSERTPLFFYPSERAVPLDSELISSIEKPVTLIVPDGSWRQAAKVQHREPAFKNILHVKLKNGPQPQYYLRRETKPGGMATFLAVARALGVLEGVHVQEELEKFFNIFAERTLWSRARLLSQDCKSEIPREAFRDYNPINQS